MIRNTCSAYMFLRLYKHPADERHGRKLCTYHMGVNERCNLSLSSPIVFNRHVQIQWVVWYVRFVSVLFGLGVKWAVVAPRVPRTVRWCFRHTHVHAKRLHCLHNKHCVLVFLRAVVLARRVCGVVIIIYTAAITHQQYAKYMLSTIRTSISITMGVRCACVCVFAANVARNRKHFGVNICTCCVCVCGERR